MFIEILKYVFLVIFLATAIIGLGSLPDWIKIPDWYRKKIFIALILEVVGVLIMLFQQELFQDSRGIPDYCISNKNWVAIDDSAFIVRPEIKISTKDTSFITALGKESFSPFTCLKSTITSNGLEIKNSKGITLFTASKKQLKQLGLFNSIQTAKGEVSSSENYAYVKWEKSDAQTGGKWKQYGSYLTPFRFDIYDEYGQTKYQIVNTNTNETVFSSDLRSKNLFTIDNRVIHFFEHNGIYYLIRIVVADLEENTLVKYTHILQIRFEPSFIDKE